MKNQPIDGKHDQIMDDKPISPKQIDSIADKVAAIYHSKQDIPVDSLIAQAIKDSDSLHLIERYNNSKTTERLGIRLTFKDRMKLRVNSKISKETESAIVIKRTLGRSLNLQKLARYRRQDIDYEKVQTSLDRIGHNFNQLVRAVNMKKPALTDLQLLISVESFRFVLLQLATELAESYPAKK